MEKIGPFDFGTNAPKYGNDAFANWQNADPATSQEGSSPPAEFPVHVMSELVHAIEAAGLVPTKDDLTQLWAAMEVAGKNAVAAEKSLTNVVQTKYGVRVLLAGQTGFVPLLSSTYIKRSDTSNLLYWISSPTFVSGSVGPSLLRFEIGGTSNEAIVANSLPSVAQGQTSAVGVITGLDSGNQVWNLHLGRGGATAWSASWNPSSLDASYLPVGGTASTIIMGEIEP